MNESSHRLVGAYAADAVDDAERHEFEQHLAECADCREEVASLQEATAAITEATSVAPPAELRDRVLAQIATVRPLPPETVTAHPADADHTGSADVVALAPRRRRRLLVAVGSAAAAVVLAVGLGVAQPWAGDPDSPVDQVLQAEDALSASLDLGDGARATVVHSEAVGRSVIETEDMPPPPDGSVYQLWYLDGGDYVSAGLMPAGRDQTVALQGESRDVDGVGITVEPSGGSETPTSEPIATFDFGPAA